MIPLKDDNPTSGRPVVTYFLIASCVLIFLIQFSSESYRSGHLFYSYGLIPSVLMGHNQLPMDLYAIPAFLTIFSTALRPNSLLTSKHNSSIEVSVSVLV